MIHDGNNAQQLLHHTSSDETSKSAKNSFNDDFSDDFDAFNAAQSKQSAIHYPHIIVRCLKLTIN